MFDGFVCVELLFSTIFLVVIVVVVIIIIDFFFKMLWLMKSSWIYNETGISALITWFSVNRSLLEYHKQTHIMHAYIIRPNSFNAYTVSIVHKTITICHMTVVTRYNHKFSEWIQICLCSKMKREKNNRKICILCMSYTIWQTGQFQKRIYRFIDSLIRNWTVK